MMPPIKFDEIQITDPSSQANGVLSARIDTRIKLFVSFHSGSPVQSLTIRKTPSVHEDRPAPEQSPRFSLEVRVPASESLIANVCSKCRNRKDQATWDIIDFRAATTVVAIENRTASVEFFIKCYAGHHGLDNHAFCVDAILQDHQNNEIDRTPLPVLINISGKVKKLVTPTNARRRAVRGVSAQQDSSYSIIPAIPHSVHPSAWDLQHSDNSTVQGLLTSHVRTFPGDVQQPNRQPPGMETITGVLPAADPSFDCMLPMLVNAPLGMMSNSQLAVQLSELGFSPHNIGSSSRLDSLPIESGINPEVVYSHTRTIPSQHDEQIIPIMSSENAPVLPHSLASTSGEPQREDCINQSTSQMSSQYSSRGPEAPNTHLGASSEQGSSGPERTRNEDINRIAGEIFLEQVVPEKGPMTGGISIAILGENFPEIPLYVWFGDTWVRTRRRDARTLVCRLPPSARPGVVNVTLSRTRSRSASEVGWSTAAFEYEDSRIEALLLMHKKIYQRADETTLQARLAQLLATMNAHANPNLNMNPIHSHNQERGEVPPRLEEVDLEEISINFLCTYSTHPNWREIVSSCNDYGQTMAHISVTLGYFRLLQHLFTWEIDLNVVDHMGLTALHYAYLFGQEECSGFLIHSSATVDDLGRSGSSLDPSLEVRHHPIIDTGGDGSTHSTSSADYNIAEAEGQDAKHFLIEQERRQVRAYTQVINQYCQGPVNHQLDWETGRVDGDCDANQRWWCRLLIDGVLRGKSIDLPKKQHAKEAAAKQAVSALGL